MIRHGPKLSIRHIHVYSCIVPCVLLTLEAHSLLPCSGLFTWGPREAFRLGTSLSLSVPSGSHTNKGPVSKWSQRRAASWSAVTQTPFSTQPGESCRHVQTSGLESEDHSDRGVGPRAQKHHRLRRCRRVAKFYEHNFSRKAHECICVEGCMSVAHVLQCQLDWT